MSHTLESYIILGIKTNIGFLKRIMDTQKFIDGDYHTHFIDENEKDLIKKHDMIDLALIAASLTIAESKCELKPGAISAKHTTTPWQEIGKWEICQH